MSVYTASENDDLILVALLKQGDASAFRRIYTNYWEKLFAFTYNRLHAREASEEVVQDVFLSIWEKRESIVVTSSLSAYLYTATRNRLFNEVRSAKVRSLYASDYASFMKNSYDNSNAEQQEVNDLQVSIETKVQELPKQCQTVFRLSRLQHIPNREIAERLNISIKTVENYLTQALRYIRTSLWFFMLSVLIAFLL